MAWCWVMLFYSFYPELPWGTSLASTAAFFRETVQGQDSSRSCQVSLECGIGLPHWPLVLGLGIQYFLVWLACFKGVELVSKVVWYTVLAPVVMLFALVVYGATLPGAAYGIIEYVGRFDPAELGSTQAWVDAAGQIFYGLSLACGVMVACKWDSGIVDDVTCGKKLFLSYHEHLFYSRRLEQSTTKHQTKK